MILQLCVCACILTVKKHALLNEVLLIYLSALCNKLVSSAHSMLIFECLIRAIDLYAFKTNNTYQLYIHILH